jgi:hypothetical protein
LRAVGKGRNLGIDPGAREKSEVLRVVCLSEAVIRGGTDP